MALYAKCRHCHGTITRIFSDKVVFDNQKRWFCSQAHARRYQQGRWSLMRWLRSLV